MAIDWTKPISMTVESVAEVEGRKGPQWELKVKFPWSLKYAETVWLDKADFLEKPEVRSYSVMVKQGALTKDSHDGGQEWMFKHYIVDFVDAAAQTAPNPNDTTPPANAPASTDQRDVGIRRSVALKAAVELASTAQAAGSPVTTAGVLGVAQAFDDWLKGPAEVTGVDFGKLLDKQLQGRKATPQAPEDDGPDRDPNE